MVEARPAGALPNVLGHVFGHGGEEGHGEGRRRSDASASFPTGCSLGTLSNVAWVDRERRTGRLIRACCTSYLGSDPEADEIHALCKLTWITKGGDDDDLPDNTASVVAPALSVITKTDLTARNPAELGRQLRDAGNPGDVVKLASRPIGFTNFYAGFRNIAGRWLQDHRSSVWSILRIVAEARTDDDVRDAYAALETLPPLPRPGAGDMPAFNLLTPVLACVDPRGRSPIINSRDAVKRRLRMLSLSSASLVERYDGLKGLIGQAGIDDAFALDTASDEQIKKAMTKVPSRPPGRTRRPPTKLLAGRHDEDLEYLRSADTISMRRRHNSMTNALRAFCVVRGLVVEEGFEQACLFDALVRDYASERHLLIEVKTEATPSMCRMAIGQLLDYRRQLHDRAAIDLAVLLPEMPSKEALNCFGYVGIKVAWFNDDMSRIEGQVRFGRSN